MNYSQTIDYLFSSMPSFQDIGCDAYKPGLDRITAFCRYLGNPQRNFYTIHVAGTNGKGSVSHILASILQQAGYRVGLYTSPHLKDFRERIRVDGEMIPKQKVVNFVDKHHAKMSELYLGDTLRKIAAEKAGIIKKSVPVVLGESNAEYDDVFEEYAAAFKSRVIYAQKMFRCEEHHIDGDRQCMVIERVRDNFKYNICIDLLGDYQYNNVITATAAADYLHESPPLTISRRAYVEGMASAAALTHLSGRWQILGREPLVVCDTGHNAHGLRYVGAELNRMAEKYPRQICVIGFAKDKNLAEILPVLPTSAHYIFTQASVMRALPAEELASRAAEMGLEGEVVKSVGDAVARARELASAEDMIFIGGSNFVVAEVL